MDSALLKPAAYIVVGFIVGLAAIAIKSDLTKSKEKSSKDSQ